MSPLERILLVAHEERMVAARPKDLPMGPAASAAKAALRVTSEAARRRRVQRAMRDAVLAQTQARRERAVELLSGGMRWEAVAEVLGVSVRSLAAHWMWARADVPEAVRRARDDYNARQYALRLASRREYFRGKARERRQAVAS